MQRLLDSSKQNPTVLRYFIQYEVLLNKPIYESYKTFCQAMGDDAMNYPEFEFWYWRFYNGELDMDYDRSEDKKPLELMQLPLEIVEKVAESCDPSSRVAVRNVSRTLRSVVDSGKVNIEHIYLRISVDPFVMINDKEIDCLENCRLPPQQLLNLIQRFLQQLLINPKSDVTNFKLSFDAHFNSDSNTSLENLSSVKSNVKSLLIKSENSVPFKEIFSLFQPGVLEHIEIDNCGKANLSFEDLFESEHFRQAKSFDMSRAGVIKYAADEQVDFVVNMFGHFSSFQISVQTVTGLSLIRLKEHFQQFATFNKFQLLIHSQTFDNVSVFEELAVTLGVNVPEDGKVLCPIPGSNDYMEFSFERTCIQMERKRC